LGKPIEEIYNDVHTGRVLGSGVSGIVRLVTHKMTGVKYAVKCLDLGLITSAEGLQQLRQEIYIMCQLDHPNIVRLEEVYESASEIYLVLELCTGGDLFDRLDGQPDLHYTEAKCAKLVKQMLSAVRYLHSKKVIHRDLKLENFLFSSDGKDSVLKMIGELCLRIVFSSLSRPLHKIILILLFYRFWPLQTFHIRRELN
jgi:calcium-dependent protein kinase